MLCELLRRSWNLEDPSVPMTGRNVLNYVEGRIDSTSGLKIGAADALTHSPVWSAVDMISSDVARIPWKAYRDGPSGREELRTHPVWRILQRWVDTNQSTNIWIIRMLAHALLHGNAYSKMHFSGNRIERLEFIHSSRVEVQRIGGQMFYQITRDPFSDEVGAGPNIEILDASVMFHLQGLTLGYLGGLSLVAFARNVIGRQLAAEVYGADFFKNSAVPQGYFSHPGKMSEPAQERLVQQFERRFGASGLRHRIGVLEEGMTWVPTAISPEDAMLIETMKWGVPEVARFFCIPPHKLGDSATKGWNTTEQENRSYFNTTLGKWVHRLCWESLKLFSEAEQADHYTAFDLDDWFKANTLERYQANALAIQWGWKTRNEVRASENMNPLDGLDDPLTPLNMTTDTGGEPPAGSTDTPAGGDSAPPETDANRNLALTFAQRDLLANQFALMNRRLRGSSSKVSPAGFFNWVGRIDDLHGHVLRSAFEPAAKMLAGICGGEPEQILEMVTSRYIGLWRDALLEAYETPEGPDLTRTYEALDASVRDLATELSLGG